MTEPVLVSAQQSDHPNDHLNDHLNDQNNKSEDLQKGEEQFSITDLFQLPSRKGFIKAMDSVSLTLQAIGSDYAQLSDEQQGKVREILRKYTKLLLEARKNSNNLCASYETSLEATEIFFQRTQQQTEETAKSIIQWISTIILNDCPPILANIENIAKELSELANESALLSCELKKNASGLILQQQQMAEIATKTAALTSALLVPVLYATVGLTTAVLGGPALGVVIGTATAVGANKGFNVEEFLLMISENAKTLSIKLEELLGEMEDLGDHLLLTSTNGTKIVKSIQNCASIPNFMAVNTLLDFHERVLKRAHTDCHKLRKMLDNSLRAKTQYITGRSSTLATPVPTPAEK